MDEFFKTKVGFTIGLLAAIFAFKPLVDANANLGFSIFSIKITVEYAYLFLTAFLGLAVYFISLQFASTKHVDLLDRVSDTCYSIALATPPVFLAFWIITVSLGYVSTFISQVPETVINFIAGAISSIFATILYRFLKESISAKFVAEEKVKERKENIELLSRAQELLKIGMYDMSVLESSKVLESALTRLLSAKGINTQKRNMLELIKLSEQHKILSISEINMLNEIRVKRNESVHLIDAVDSAAATRILQLSRELMLKLDSITSSSGYEWLERNREKAIELLKEGNSSKCGQVIKMLTEAWKNRDGAVWLEVSEFFEVALTYNPNLLIDMFVNEEELLDSWLESADVQLFTDFIGGEANRLETVKNLIISKLTKYIDDESNQERIAVAKKILKAIENSEIREIQ